VSALSGCLKDIQFCDDNTKSLANISGYVREISGNLFTSDQSNDRDCLSPKAKSSDCKLAEIEISPTIILTKDGNQMIL
jgi:hypothetical protein